MERIRLSAVAGSFYPENASELKKMISGFLKQVKTGQNINPATIRAAIVPHAGYIFSGQTAAYTYKLIGQNKNLNQFILLGPSHYGQFNGATQDNHGFWQTPLGKIRVAQIPNQSPLIIYPQAQMSEHCLEVQLPFLQYSFNNFSITPILTSLNCDYRKLAKVLIPHFNPQTILLVSSDLSHFYPESQARKIDQRTIKQILKLRVDELEKAKYEACGKVGILTLLAIAKTFRWKPQLLFYDTSFTASGDDNQVVGYASIFFTSK